MLTQASCELAWLILRGMIGIIRRGVSEKHGESRVADREWVALSKCRINHYTN